MEAQMLLDVMHSTQSSSLDSGENSSAKKSAYTCAKQKTLSKLCAMKYRWWSCRSAELQDQDALDRHDMKAFHPALSPRKGTVVPHLSNRWML